MKNTLSISICIPTYKRPGLLLEAIKSCLDQTVNPVEIIIGDDSPGDDTSVLIKELIKTTDVKIRYFHNKPSLKQALNVNDLFSKAEGKYTMLLHDDDLLLPNALDDLYQCFVENPDIEVAFGKQYLISDTGVVDMDGSEEVNKVFYRSAIYEGSKLSPLEAGFLQQFPNDAYLIKSDVAKKIGYTEAARDACDFDFALRVGKGNHKTYFLNTYTAKYRLSDEAVSKNADFNGGLISYQLVEELQVPAESMHYKSDWLKKKAGIAIVQALNLKQKKVAVEVYFSEWHRGSILSLGGIRRLLLILTK